MLPTSEVKSIVNVLQWRYRWQLDWNDSKMKARSRKVRKKKKDVSEVLGQQHTEINFHKFVDKSL